MARNKVIETSVHELVFDDHNFNKGTQYGQHLMEESLRRFGVGRSILIDKNNRIIAGNKTVENAGQLDIEDVLIVETTGNQIVAVKRTDIDLDTKDGREMAMADNATSAANLAWDAEEIFEKAEEFGIVPNDWGVKVEMLNPDELSDDFELENGERGNVRHMGFVVSTEQQELITQCLERVMGLCPDEMTFGNSNKNGNALYYIISQWAEQKK